MAEGKPSSSFHIDPLRVRLALRATIAFLVGMWVSPHIPHIQVQWVLISIAVLMSSEVRLGAVLQKTSARVMGTAIGAVPAVAIATLAGPNTEVAHYGLLLVVAGVTYWGVSLYETSPPATLAVVTAAMLLADPSQTREHAATRLASILVGAVIAVLAAHLLFPIRSRWALQRASLDTLTLMRDYTGFLVRKEDPPPTLGASIFAKLALQRRLIEESRLEKRRYDKESDLKLWTRQRVLFRYLQIMAMGSSQPEMDQMAEIQGQIEALIARGGPVPKTWECERQEVPGYVLDYSLQTMRHMLTDLGAPDSSAGDPAEGSKLP